MNQEELKQRLIELLKECTFGINNHILTDYVLEETLKSVAEHLVKNGVTIRERGEWVKRTPCSEPECSRCGRCPKLVFGMLPDFCPHCGSDMRGVKDE